MTPRTAVNEAIIAADLEQEGETVAIAEAFRAVQDEQIDLTTFAIDPGAATLVPEHICKRYGILPIGFDDARLIVAMSDTSNVLAIDDVRTITGYAVKPVIAHADEILDAMARLSRTEASWAHLVEEATEGDEAAEDRSAFEGLAEEGPIIKLVNLLIGRAINSRASDIHVEPEQRQLRVRYRIDGVLHEVMRIPKAVQAGVCSRIKLMAEMDISERRIPQDGRCEVFAAGESVDLRVATLPTMFGEKIVIRILRKSGVMLDLRDLGISAYNFERLTAALVKPQGMILVTGPTGSGKTTTLYAGLHAVNDAAKNIITVEDPVEYCLQGAYQVQINPKAGLTFASALRAILRSDPDIVLVGEIRDRETAMLGIEAALTGHLVLSSLHTNDASSAVTRLTEMGIEPYLVASSVDCVVAQRLVRVLCDRCKEEYEPDDEVVRELGIAVGADGRKPLLMRPIGCTHCSNTGYRGRTAVHEIMLMDGVIERMCVDRAPSEQIAAVARKNGMRTMFEDALEKVLAGVTSIEEVLRAIGTKDETIDEEPAASGDVVGIVAPAPVAPAAHEPKEPGPLSWRVTEDGKLAISFGG